MAMRMRTVNIYKAFSASFVREDKSIFGTTRLHRPNSAPKHHPTKMKRKKNRIIRRDNLLFSSAF